MATQKRTIGRALQKVTMPEQSSKPVMDAYATAKSLRGTLATLKETIFDTQILTNAKEGRYLLAVDSKDLPTVPKWHKVIRDKNTNSVNFESISEKEANSLINADRWNEVLYVNESAIKAAKEQRPVALARTTTTTGAGGASMRTSGLTVMLGWQLSPSLSRKPQLHSQGICA